MTNASDETRLHASPGPAAPPGDRVGAAPSRVVRLSFSRDVDARPDVVWRVMTDHPRYADVADNLSRVEVLEGDGLGMRRRCADTKGRAWTERCVLFEAERRYSFVVDTDAPDYPYPLRHVQGTWGLAPTARGTRIHMTIEAAAKGGVFGFLMLWFLQWPIRGVGHRLLRRWAARMEADARAA